MHRHRDSYPDAVITASGYESLCRCIDQNATFHSEGTAEDSCHCNEGYKRVESFGLCENDCAPNTILSADGNCTPCGDNEAAVEGACAECTMGFPKVDGSGCVTCAVAQGTLPSGTKWGRRPAATPRPEESEMRYLQIIENESEPAPMKFECEGDDGEEEKVEIPIVQCDASGLVSGYLNGHQVPAETDAVCAAYSPAR